MFGRKQKKVSLLLIGFARSGKDFAAEFWRENFGFTFQSSSLAAAEIFLYSSLKDRFNYKTIEECFEDRVHHRKLWHDLICDYNKYDKARLAKQVVAKYGSYVGMRDSAEINACKRVDMFDYIVWIDASQRVGVESLESCKVTEADADFTIDNNGTLEEFETKLLKIGKLIFNVK